MIPDADILEARVAAFRDLPWPIPAVVILAMRDEDLDRLDASADAIHYWTTLNEIVRRIEASEA